MAQVDNRIQNIDNLLRNAEKNIHKAYKLLETLSSDLKNSYEDIPGTLGIFDGECMITADGKKYEVNPNYAAKSMLVVGDNLKMIEEGDKKLFKQVSKVPRKELQGILNKKEGKWYALTDSGSYRVLDVAVEFRRGQMNDEIRVVIPADNLNSPYAALEKLAKDDERPVLKKAEEPQEKAERSEPKPKKPKAKKPAAPKKEKKEEKVEEKPAETSEVVESILEDDLV